MHNRNLFTKPRYTNHLNDWLNGEKLAPANGGSDSYLSEEKTAELVIYLTNNLLHTTQAIIEQVIDWWGIRYIVPGMTKYLHRNGFIYRKPVGIPHKFSAEAQQVFVENYNELKQKKPVLTQGTKLAYGWMLAGKKTQPVETTGSRTRLNIMGAMNFNDIGSTVVRALKKIIIRKLPNKRAETVVIAFRDIEANTFCEFKTLTVDNGHEFALHEQITQITGEQVYFARPYYSWESGLNEHINGLIRRFYPKRTDFSQVSHRKIAELEHTVNTSGRKSLGYRSPNEVFLRHLLAA